MAEGQSTEHQNGLVFLTVYRPENFGLTGVFYLEIDLDFNIDKYLQKQYN